MSYPEIIILSFSVSGLLISYHYLVIRPVDKEINEVTHCYETDFNALADLIDLVDSSVRLRIVENLIKAFKDKYYGNAYLDYDCRKLEKRMENLRVILEEEKLVMN